MDLEALEEIGLTKGETKVYLTLTKLGMSKTGKLTKEADVCSSKIYKILDRLEKKGLVGHIIIGKVKHYKATEPERVLQYVEEKEKEIRRKKEIVKELIPQLRVAQDLSKTDTEVVLYEGLKGIMNLFMNMIDELKSGDEYLVLGADYGLNMPGVRSFFQKYHTERAKRGIKVKMLASFKTKGNLVKETSKLSNIKYLPQSLFTKMDTIIYKDKLFLFFISNESKSILIENKEMAESFRTYFNNFWKMAKS